MFRVILVDDEMLMRVAMRSIIDWESLGFRIIGEYENGRLALDDYENALPDVVFTDMRMPVMDGIQLIGALKEKRGDIICIALSSYDDFSYVREALRLGAEDYLLKLDIRKEFLIAFLERLSQKLSPGSGAQHVYRTPEWLRSRRGFLAQWMRGGYPEEENLRHHMAFYHVQLHNEPLCCLALLVKSIPEYYLGEHRGDLPIAVVNLLETVLQNEGRFYCVAFSDTEYGCVGACGESETLVRSLQSAVVSMLNLTDVTIRMKAVHQLTDVREAFEEFGIGCRQGAAREKADEAEEIPGRTEINPMVPRIKRYIQEHYAEDITLDTLAGAFSMSASHISRLLSRQMGGGFTEYVTHVRMERAKERLMATDDKIWQIAESVGYADTHYFSKVFRKQTGKTPVEWRQASRDYPP